MQVRVRLGNGIARFAPAPVLSIDVADGATVADAFAELGAAHPDLEPALRSALPVVAGRHVERRAPLRAGDELALLMPLSGG
jgi:molybdopterin converting factor small subunit